MANEKVKIRDLAKQLNTSGKRIVEKLQEINIEKSHMGSLDEVELKAFYAHIGFKPAAEHSEALKSAAEKAEPAAKSEKSGEAKKKSEKAAEKQRPTGIIMRRVVYDDSPTSYTSAPSNDSTPATDKNGKKGGKQVRAAASSGLRQGYQVHTADSYEELMQTAKREEAAARKTASTAAPTGTGTVKRITRIKASEKDQEKKEPAAETAKTEAPVQEVPEEKAPAKEAAPAAAVKETPAAEPVSAAKEEKKEPEKPAAAAQPEKQEPVRRPEHPASRPAPRPVRNGAPVVPPAPISGEPPKKDGFGNKSFEKNNKKPAKRDSSRPVQNQGKDKYKSAKQFVGDKKGVSEVYSDDFVLSSTGIEDGRGFKRGKKKDNRKPNKYSNKVAPSAPHIIAVLTNVKLPETMTVKTFAEAIKKTSADVIKKLMLMGIMANQNQEIDFDTAAIIASEYGITAEKEVVVSVEELLFDEESEEEDTENMVERPPVVVVMGHVDHGKTSLLDAIRSTNVTSGEAGGITQHIGAYMVDIKGRKLTFLDTPGHEAFTAMRARGAQVTDVAIIVVAADDGVMPQTVEAINHAKAANVTIIVAVNKIDKEGANVDRVKQELAEYELIPEEWGGDTIFVPVSAKKRENIELLLENVLLSTDILQLKADPTKQAKGTIIEAKLDKNKGPVATLLVQRGTLNQGDTVISGTSMGRVRTMTDDKGRSIQEAGPSTPVEITGMPEVPEAGEVFYAVKDEKLARQLVEKRKSELREKSLKSSAKVSLDALFSQIQEGSVKELNIVVKADVQGSVEAVKQSLEKLSNEEVKVNVIHGGVGAVTESDVTLAQVSNAIIIGFNVRPGVGIAESAENAGVDLRLYRVIYDAIDDVKAAMVGMLDPEFKEVVSGHVEVRQTFKVSGVGTIAGGYVTDGKIVRNSDVRIVRDGIVIFEGKLASLKRFKDDVKEVAQGFECGLSFEKYNDVKEGDVVEAFIMEEIERK